MLRRDMVRRYDHTPIKPYHLYNMVRATPEEQRWMAAHLNGIYFHHEHRAVFPWWFRSHIWIYWYLDQDYALRIDHTTFTIAVVKWEE